MNAIRHSTSLLLLILLTQVCRGQDTFDALYFDQLTINEGLSHNTVLSILQDQYGYIWIGTQNGLNRYDGYTFQVYQSLEQTDGEEGFIGKYISALFEDKAGNLWVGTRKNGINIKRSTSNRFINLQEDAAFAAIKGYEVSSFFEDKVGNIWITTIGAGILKYDPHSRTSQLFTTENSQLSNNITFDIVEDKYGTIWVAAVGERLNVLKGNQFVMSHERSTVYSNMWGYRKKLLLDDDYLWIGTDGTGLYRMNLDDRQYIHFAAKDSENAINSDVIRDLYLNEDGRLFIATDGGGLNVYNKSTAEMTSYQYDIGEETALNSNALLCMWGDRTGNVWMGTHNGGVNIYKPNKTWFEFFAPSLARSDELQHRSILAICQNSDGNIVIGTDGGGLTWLAPENSQFLNSTFTHDPADPNSIAGNVIKAIVEDHKKRLWVGVFRKGVDLYQRETKTFEHVLSGPLNIWSITEGKNGDILVTTLGDGLYIIDGETKKARPFQSPATHLNITTDVDISSVFVDNKDRLWLGSLNNGLDLMDEEANVFQYFQHDPLDSLSISNDEIRAIFQDSKGEIWIGTEGGGLNRWLGNGHFERIGKKEEKQQLSGKYYSCKMKSWLPR